MQHTFSYLPAVSVDEGGLPSQNDTAKHRRSRNGCFTCRTRRVKCDEGRPTCERCIKARRECLYPAETPAHLPRPTRVPTVQRSPSTQVLATVEADSSPELHNQAPLTQPFHANNKEHFTSSSRESSLLTPSEFEPLPRTSYGLGIQPAKTRRHISDLSASERFYLDYQKKNMSHYHYGLNTDTRGFIHKFLIDSALNNNALLQAVIAFAAYHHAIRHNGKLQDFLKPYSEALSLLRLSLGSGKPPDVTDLLTMLQLSALEEALGDWINLQSHQKAAYSILTSLYDANTLTQNDTGNRLLEWFIRFDLITSFIAGSPAALSRDWHEATHRYFLNQIKESPHDLAHKYDERGAAQRLLAQDVAALFRKAGKVPPEEFQHDASLISQSISAWYRDLSPSLLDPSKILHDYPHNFSPVLRTENDADSAIVYGDDLWPTNHMMVHFWSLELMFNHHLSMIQGESTSSPAEHVTNIALKICQIFEAVQQRDPMPGALLGVQAASGMAVPFLRREPAMIMWGRQKQALIERSGYVYPAAYRAKMSEAWGIDVSHWWLPNDEGFLPILQQVRSFIEYRTTPPKDRNSERLRELAGIFETLRLSGWESSSTGTRTPSDGGREYQQQQQQYVEDEGGGHIMADLH